MFRVGDEYDQPVFWWVVANRTLRVIQSASEHFRTVCVRQRIFSDWRVLGA